MGNRGPVMLDSNTLKVLKLVSGFYGIPMKQLVKIMLIKWIEQMDFKSAKERFLKIIQGE